MPPSTGPWTVQHMPISATTFIADADGNYIATVIVASATPWEENAQLIASSHDLLEALEEISSGIQFFLERHGDRKGRLVSLLTIADTAIAKATTPQT